MHTPPDDDDDEDDDQDDDEAPDRNLKRNQDDDECDEDDDDCEFMETYSKVTGNRRRDMIQNAKCDDPLPLPGETPTRTRTKRERQSITRNLLGTVDSGDDVLPQQSCLLHNYAGSQEAFQAVINAQIGFGNRDDNRGPGGQPKMHSWDNAPGGASVEQGGIKLGVTSGQPTFGDRIDPRTMTPAEFLAEAMQEDAITKWNRKRLGIPETDNRLTGGTR
jgi:hypothetical protein